MKIAFICVNYNNHQITLNYINNVLRMAEGHEVKVIVVDNASNADDISALATKMQAYPAAILLKSAANKGYFNGLNQGVAWAINNGFNQYQVIGNNDIEFEPDFLAKLQGINLATNELVIAPDVLTLTGIHENPHVVNRVSNMRKMMYAIYYTHYYIAKLVMLFYSDERKAKAFDPIKKHIYMGIGALYVLSPHFFKHFNQLWDKLFLYGEEAIFGAQIASVNGKILYEPQLKCYHNESATTSKMSSRHKYEVVRSSYKVYKKYL